MYPSDVVIRKDKDKMKKDKDKMKMVMKNKGEMPNLIDRMLKNYQVYLFLMPALVYFAVFHYAPMFGVQIAFKNFLASKGILGSPWVGWHNFDRLFKSYQFPMILKNTVLLSVENLVFTFPVPIIFALLLNQLKYRKLQKFIQTVTYAPYFISTVVIVGLLFVFTKKDVGIVNILISKLGMKQVLFMGEPGWFRPLYILSSIWQFTGWDSIVYVAALTGINPDLYEAAMVDGASKLQRIWHIDIPGILPTATVIFILRAGQLMKLGFEKAYLMQTPLNLETSEVISTFVYKMGLQQAQYSFAAATDLFNSVINLVLIFVVNKIAQKVGETSLW